MLHPAIWAISVLVAAAPQPDRADDLAHRHCEWQYRIVLATESVGSPAAYATSVLALGDIYDQYALSGKLGLPALQRCQELLLELLRVGALPPTCTRGASEERVREHYERALRLNQELRRRLPRSDESYRHAFYAGEMLFKLERWQDAAEAYTEVVRQRPGGRFAKEAAYAAAESWSRALDPDEELSLCPRRPPLLPTMGPCASP